MGTRRARTHKTAEQASAERRERAEAMQATIATQVEAMAQSEGWTAFLDYIAHFHGYSLKNTLLIMAQHPTATQVAGFRKWQELGRQVRKGEKAIRIFGYSHRNRVETDPDTGDETTTKIPTFPILSVFAQDQTDPIDGVTQIPTPADIAAPLTGEDTTGIYDRIAAAITAHGWTVTREPIPGSVNGYTSWSGDRRIVVDDALSPAMAAKTMCHEAAHALMHDAGDIDRTEIHRGIREVEAESVAYVLAGLAGLDTTDYSIGYITGWSDGDAELVTATATRVLACVHTLADALNPTADDVDADTAA